MAQNIDQEVAALRQMSVRQLQTKYAELFGEQPRGRHPPRAGRFRAEIAESTERVCGWRERTGPVRTEWPRRNSKGSL
jgi:hypothetical protein